MNKGIPTFPNGPDTIRPAALSPQNDNTSQKKSVIPVNKSNVSVVAHRDGSKQQLFVSCDTYLTRHSKYNEDKWNTTEVSGMKLSHSCPTFAELSASMKEKGINKCKFSHSCPTFADLSSSINENYINESTQSKTSLKDSSIKFVGKHLYTMKKSSSSTLTTCSGGNVQMKTKVKLINVKPFQAP